MTDWYNCTTFDIIGDLSFGKSFDCLATGGCHLWVKTIFDFVVAGTVLAKVNRWIPMRFIKMLIPKSVQQKRLDFAHSTRELVAKRLSLGEGARPDFTSFTPRNRGLEEDGKVSMSDAEITINSMVLVLAGSETTATLLSGVAYHLLRNPEAMARAVKEVREAFASDDEITFASISKLEYLLACLNEAMRIYPPVAGALFRRMESEAGVVDGHLVPPDVSGYSVLVGVLSESNETDTTTSRPARASTSGPHITPAATSPIQIHSFQSAGSTIQTQSMPTTREMPCSRSVSGREIVFVGGTHHPVLFAFLGSIILTPSIAALHTWRCDLF